jgi:GTP pyrophosphokinase
LSLQSQYAYRVIAAKWIDSTQHGYKATLRLTGIDNLGLVNEVTKVISNHLNVNIHKLNISGEQGYFQGEITVNVKNNKQLTNVMQQLKKIDGIEKVVRLAN